MNTLITDTDGVRVYTQVTQPFDIPIHVDLSRIAEGEDINLPITIYVKGKQITASIDLWSLKSWIDESKATLEDEINVLQLERQQLQTALAKMQDLTMQIESAENENIKRKGGEPDEWNPTS